MLDSSDRILTTHAGSLPRTEALLRANKLWTEGEYPGGWDAFSSFLEEQVLELVERQIDTGLDVVGDGEYGKAMSSKLDFGAWWTYSFARTGGLELSSDTMWTDSNVISEPGNPQLTGFSYRRDWTAFHDAYTDPTSGVSIRSEGAKSFPKATGPLSYIGHDALAVDIANMKAAVEETGAEEGFITALSPGSASRIGNEYYSSEEEWLYAWADVLREEYQAIIDEGLILQIDDPSIAEAFDQITPEPSIEDYLAFTKVRVEALNYALRDLPEDRIRFHLCWGSWHGPHTTDLPFEDIIDLMLTIRAGAYSFEGANVRHEHEWRVWENTALPEGKLIIPGVVSHATNVVEHPRLVADRIIRYAQLVGRENVIASTDCGLGGRIHGQIAWAKLASLVEGAHLATTELWG